jgi:hypothetical protein
MINKEPLMCFKKVFLVSHSLRKMRPQRTVRMYSGF